MSSTSVKPTIFPYGRIFRSYGAGAKGFVTGTFAGLTVFEIDGRQIGTGRRGPMVDRLQRLYLQLLDTEVGPVGETAD